MVLTAALEFDPRNNKEATIRPTDNVEVPQVKTEVCFWERSFIREETWFEGVLCPDVVFEMDVLRMRKEKCVLIAISFPV